MLKIAALLFNSIALLFYQLFFTDGVTITPSISSNAQIGNEFTIEMTIDKGSNSGFAKLQQDLPAGFTAVEGENGGGSFTFINQSVKIIWMALPTASSFKVSYKVKVSKDVSGNQNLSGKFAYVSDNVKQTIDIPVTTITISEGKVSQTEAVVQTPASTPQAITPSETKASDSASTMNCLRKLPGEVVSNTDFLVDVTIQKGALADFGKLVETLPEGFTAQEVQSEGAVFSFEDQKVTYIWGSMPEKPELKISYKVKTDANANGDKSIEGAFSYIQNSESMQYTIAPSIVKIVAPGSSSASVAEITEKTESVPVETITEVESSPQKEVTPKELLATNIPTPQVEGKMNYKVQILALKKVKNAEKVAVSFKLKEVVSLEMAEGFTKYTVGNHQEYISAHDARDRYTAQNGVVGPFVTAYNNGKRITVQEALMISNQKWYK